MKDEEKKFIKETIDDAIDKKFAAFDKKQETARKSDALSQDKKQEQQKKELLEELRELDKKGQATMAQKFELFKLSVKESQDVQNAWNDTKKSAQQIGKGVSTINRKIMMSNPLTAMLYENRDLFGAAWDITSGTLKTGFNIAKGAAGLLKAATKKKQEEAEQEEELNLPKPKFDTPETQAEVILQEKEEWQKKIDDIHDAVAKERKEGSKATTILAQGLTGLNKTMKLVSEGVQFIGAKQKLILAAVGLGAMGILALVSWFKSGGFSKALDKVKDDMLNSLSSEQGQKKRKEADDYVAGELDKVKTDAAETQNMINDMNLSSQGDVFKELPKDPTKNMAQNELASKQNTVNKLQDLGFTQPQAQQLYNYKKQHNITGQATKTNYNKSFVFKLPFDTTVADITKQDDKHSSFRLSRGQGTSNVSIYITHAISNSLKSGKKQRNTQIAILDVGAVIFGDWQAFLGVNEGTSLEDAIYNDRAADISKKANDIMDEAYHTPGVGTDVMAREADKRLGTYKEYNKDNLKQKAPDTQQKSEFTQEKPTVTSTSVNPEKAAQQQEQLSKKEEQQTEQVAQAPQTQQSTQATPVVIAQNPATPVAWPDKNIPTGAYMHMVASYVDTNGVC